MGRIFRLLPRRLFGYSCSQVDDYIEEWQRQKENELRRLRTRIDLALQAHGELLKEISALLGELQSERLVSDRVLSVLLELVEKLASSEEEARKAFEEAVEARRQRLAELDAKYEALAGVMRALADAAAGLDSGGQPGSGGAAQGEDFSCSEERS